MPHKKGLKTSGMSAKTYATAMKKEMSAKKPMKNKKK